MASGRNRIRALPGAVVASHIKQGNEEETEMSVIGGVLLFAAGAAIGGGAVAYHKGCVRVVEHRAAREKDALRREVYDVKFRSECDRAYRKGYSDGRADPLSDAEKLARTFQGRRVDVRTQKGA